MPRITELQRLTVPGDNDDLAIVDNAGAITKKINRSDLLSGAPLPEGIVTTDTLADSAVVPSKLGDTGWVDLVATAPFSAVNSPAVRRIGNVVYTRGNFSRASGFSASDSTVATIPVGFRPSTSSVVIPNAGSYSTPDAFYNGTINSSGTITTRQGVAFGGWMNFGGIAWTVD